VKKFYATIIGVLILLPQYVWGGYLTSPISTPIATSTITSLFDHHFPDYGEDSIFVRFDGMRWIGNIVSRNNCISGSFINLHCYDGHNGIDFAVPVTTSVIASAPGTLQSNDYDICGGYTTRVWHQSEGYSTMYGHVSEQLFAPNSPVERFDVIAESGGTGTCTTGPHLHFGLRQGQTGGLNIDPYGWSPSSSAPVQIDPWLSNIGYLWTTTPLSLTPPPTGNTLPVINVPMIITQNTTWSTGNVYLVNTTLVNPGVALTINPGAIVKFEFQHSFIEVQGTLSAQGIATNKIYFTSYKDDTVGGDTNGDGASTTPTTASDFRGFVVQNGGKLELENAVIRYGGYQSCGWVSCTGDAVIENSGQVNATSTVMNRNRMGIFIRGGSANLYRTTITNSSQAGISNYWAWGDVNLSLKESTISQSAGGIAITGYPTSVNLSISDSSISESENYGITVYSQYIPVNISITNTHFVNNRGGDGNFGGYQSPLNLILRDNTSSPGTIGNGFHLSGNLGSQIWNGSVPFILGPASVQDLTVSPGTVIKFENPQSRLSIGGSLNVQGLPTNKIYFTSFKDDTVGGDSNGDGATTTPSNADYQGLYIGSNSPINISNVEFRYGGADDCYWVCYPKAAIVHASSNSSLNISGSTFRDNRYGIRIENGATTTISNTVIKDSTYNGVIAVSTNGSSPIYLSITDSRILRSGSTGVLAMSQYSAPLNLSITNTYFAYNLYGDGSFSAGGVIDFINRGNSSPLRRGNGFTISGTMTGNQVWNPGVPFIVGVVSTNNNLTINPGTIVKFSGDQSRLQLGGNLIARGKKDNQIYFTSYQDDTVGGDSNSDGFSTVPVPGDYGGIFLYGTGNNQISNSVIRYGGRCVGQWICTNYGAIMQSGSGNLSLDSNIISQNEYGVERRAGTMTLNQNAIFANTQFGLYHNGTGTSTVATNNWWGDASGPRHTNNPTGLGDQIWGNVIFAPWLLNCNFEGCVTS